MTDRGRSDGSDKSMSIDEIIENFELLEEWVPRSYPNRTGLELMLWWRRKA